MKLTLLVENNPKIESFFSLNLATWLGLDTVTKKKGEFALKFLEENPEKVNLIIVRSKIEKEFTAKLLIEYLKIKNLRIPLIIVGPGDFAPHSQVKNSPDPKALIKSAATALSITAKDMAEKVVPDFFPIPILYFHGLKRAVCPVYSQDMDDSQKYELRIEKQREIDPGMITKMVEEGVAHLYVDKMNRLSFVSNITAELISQLEQDELNEDEQISAADKSMELLSKKIVALGITEETISLAKKNMAIIRNNVKKAPKLNRLIEKLINNKTSYLFKHTQILTYVGLHIIHNIDWGNEEQEEKMSFIAFFHDIALEDDVQCQIKSTNELKRANLPPQSRILVEKHAQIAAELVSKFPHAPMGTDQLIRQHHGQLNGLGFSEHYGANISPMSIVFIVAEEFTRIVMKREHGPFDREEMMKELKSEFPTSRFAKIVDKLNTLTL